MAGADKVDLVFIINGEDTVVEVNVHPPLHVAVREALRISGNTGRTDPADWELRDGAGTLLDTNRSVQDYGLPNGARLYLSLRVGAGG